jgi:ABC-type polysaccharide/polyol phosphate export permease
MTAYLAAIWQCRYFWMSLVKMDLRTRYRRSILGLGWSLLNPIAMTGILCLAFGTVLKMDVVHYAPFLFAGLATWTYIQTTALNGCQCFFQGESYIRQHPTPMAIYPLRTALGGSIHFLIALTVTLLLAWYCLGLHNWLGLFSLIPTIVLLFIFAWALAILMGFANVHFQDTQHLAEVGFQILFYASGIIYDFRSLQDCLLKRLMMNYNPMVSIIGLVREPIVNGQLPSPQMYGVALTTIALTVGAAGFTLYRLQRRLIFHL